jgi:hypothetical protein
MTKIAHHKTNKEQKQCKYSKETQYKKTKSISSAVPAAPNWKQVSNCKNVLL